MLLPWNFPMWHSEATILCRHAWHFTCLLYSSVENIFCAASSWPHPCDNVQCCCALYLPSSPQSSALQLRLRIWPCYWLSHNTQAVHTDARTVWTLSLVGVWALFVCKAFKWPSARVCFLGGIFGAECKFLFSVLSRGGARCCKHTRLSLNIKGVQGHAFSFPFCFLFRAAICTIFQAIWDNIMPKICTSFGKNTIVKDE